MKKPEQTYILMALTRHWNDNPQDRDIPFIGLPTETQNQILDRAQLFQTQDEQYRLKQVVNYQAVQQ